MKTCILLLLNNRKTTPLISIRNLTYLEILLMHLEDWKHFVPTGTASVNCFLAVSIFASKQQLNHVDTYRNVATQLLRPPSRS